MKLLKNVRSVLLLSLLFVIFSVLNIQNSLAAASDDLVIATVLSEITGVPVSDITNCKNNRGNWKEANQLIFDQFTMNHRADITQQIVDDLKLKGYKFKDIFIAAQLATAFKSTPEAILKLKPLAMDWRHYGGLLMQYKLFRRVFRRIDENPGAFNRAKEEIIAAELLDDSSASYTLRNTPFSGEELLGIIILADLNGVTKETLLSELKQANLSAKQTLTNVLLQYNQAIGGGN